MPRAIKPQMSADMLSSFDFGIDNIYYDDDSAVVVISTPYGIHELYFNENDLQEMITFIHRNQIEEV